MSHQRARLAVVLCLGLFALAAWASDIPRFRGNVASTSMRYSTGYLGARISVQCEYPVWIATGSRLADGGTKRTSDGGQPILPSALDVLATFPGDPYQVTLGPSEKSVAVLSQSVGDGGNFCNINELNAP